MKKKAILSILTLCILGAELFACHEDTGKKGDTNKATLHSKKKSKVIDQHSKKRDAYPDDIYEAFAQVVDVVQAPLKDRELFLQMLKSHNTLVDVYFPIFSGDKSFYAIKQGWESPQIGTGTEDGSGTWYVTAGHSEAIAAIHDVTSAFVHAIEIGKDDRIVYGYRDYQPKGSNLKVNGTMQAMYRSQGVNAVGKTVDAIGFTTVKYGKDTVDTLNITGLYMATLKFTYKEHGIQSAITAETYYEKLIGDNSMFSGKNMSKIEFTYDGLTIVLNQKLRQDLLHVQKP